MKLKSNSTKEDESFKEESDDDKCCWNQLEKGDWCEWESVYDDE